MATASAPGVDVKSTDSVSELGLSETCVRRCTPAEAKCIEVLDAASAKQRRAQLVDRYMKARTDIEMMVNQYRTKQPGHKSASEIQQRIDRIRWFEGEARAWCDHIYDPRKPPPGSSDSVTWACVKCAKLDYRVWMREHKLDEFEWLEKLEEEVVHESGLKQQESEILKMLKDKLEQESAVHSPAGNPS